MKTGTLHIAPIANGEATNGHHPVMASVIGKDGVVHQTELYTNANGMYSTSLPEGQYTLQFEGRGLQTLVKRGVRVVEDGATQVVAGPMIPGDGHTIVRYNEHDARSRQTRMILGLVVYYLVLLLFAFWLLLDVWSGDFKFLRLLVVSTSVFAKPLLKTVSFTMSAACLVVCSIVIGNSSGTTVVEVSILVGSANTSPGQSKVWSLPPW